MQTNFELPGLGGRVIPVPVPRSRGASRSADARPLLTNPTRFLLRAHVEVARTEAKENLVWSLLAVGAALTLALSFSL